MKTFKRITNILLVSMIFFSSLVPTLVVVAVKDTTEEGRDQRVAPAEVPERGSQTEAQNNNAPPFQPDNSPLATETAPYMVKDISSGGSSAFYIEYHPELLDVNGTLFFRTDDGIHGEELWKSDGTESGTVMVKDISPGSASSMPVYFIEVNGTLFFVASDDTHGRELWKSDGTEAGTVMVKDINNSESSFPATPYGSDDNNVSVSVNGTLFFRADDGIHGYELWKSDGTLAGTVMVKDINPGSVNSTPQNITEINGILFFLAHNDSTGFEVWKSDGTEAGTVIVKDIYPGSGTAWPGLLTSVNGILFFKTSSELWKSDGTEEGTVIIKGDLAITSDKHLMSNINGTLFFAAVDTSDNYGRELWKSDGTEEGTVMVRDINPSGSSNPYEFTNVNGTLFFAADDGSSDSELWKSDGTETGTVMVKNIKPDGRSLPDDLTNVNGTLFFTADDGNSGRELWKSDGTLTGTVMVRDINPGSAESYIREMSKVGDELFFVANDGVHGRELWKYNVDASSAEIPPVVVIVHGWQGAKREGYSCDDNIWPYWTWQPEDSTLGKLPEWFTSQGYEVWIAHWDTSKAGTPSLLENAQCLANQINSFSDKKNITIVAHSMGGLVSRVAINYAGVAERVKALYTLGTPHAGLHDRGLSVLYHFLGICDDFFMCQKAVRETSTLNVWSFNSKYKNHPDVSYDFIGGSYDWTAGSSALLRDFGGSGPNDGLIGKYSAIGWVYSAGVFFPDWTSLSPPGQYWTDEVHSSYYSGNENDDKYAYYETRAGEFNGWSHAFQCLIDLMNGKQPDSTKPIFRTLKI